MKVHRDHLSFSIWDSPIRLLEVISTHPNGAAQVLAATSVAIYDMYIFTKVLAS